VPTSQAVNLSNCHDSRSGIRFFGRLYSKAAIEKRASTRSDSLFRATCLVDGTSAVDLSCKYLLVASIPKIDCSFQQKITGVIKIDTTKFYKDVDGQAARRKRERKQRYLLSLGKFII
jgi:hypothetical protein